MYKAQEQQEELTGLFARSMHISNPTPPPEILYDPPPQPSFDSHQAAAPPIVYASMHYTHTRHVVPVRFRSTPETTPEPQLPLSDDEMITMLTLNTINPQSLFPSQVHLLRHADPEQRLRLLELWRISPPDMSSYDLIKQQGSWADTNLQKEEDMARQRHQRMTECRGFCSTGQRSVSSDPELAQAKNLENISSSTTLNGTSETYATPPERPSSAPGTYAEPYMMSVYEQLAKRDYDAQDHVPLRESNRYNSSTDPVYVGFGGQKSGQENTENHPVIDDEMEL
jgi:hypothetical protein